MPGDYPDDMLLADKSSNKEERKKILKTEYFSHGLDLREYAMRTGLGQLLVEYDNGDKFTATATLCQVD